MIVDLCNIDYSVVFHISLEVLRAPEVIPKYYQGSNLESTLLMFEYYACLTARYHELRLV